MNTIAIIILAAIILDYTLNGLADYLNLTMLRNELPHAFRGVYDPDRYRKSQKYLKINTRFGWVTATFNVTVILIFWFAKGFPLLDEWVRSFNYGSVINRSDLHGGPIIVQRDSLASIQHIRYLCDRRKFRIQPNHLDDFRDGPGEGIVAGRRFYWVHRF